jgi:hypothetical protein
MPCFWQDLGKKGCGNNASISQESEQQNIQMLTFL